MILTPTKPDAPGGVPQYYRNLQGACDKLGVPIGWVTLADWLAGAVPRDPNRDLLICTNQYAAQIPNEYAVIAVQHGCAMQHGLVNGYEPHVAMGAKQLQAARRPRTFWVACSDYAAYQCKRHMGVRAHRIILAAVDTTHFAPSERQRLRETAKPIILCHAPGADKGSERIPQVQSSLGGAFQIRNLTGIAAGAMPEAMRAGDMWLSLSRDEGLPTAVQEAMSTDLLVVGSATGLLWSYNEGVPLYAGGEAAVAWANKETGCVSFAPELLSKCGWVAEFVKAAWHHRAKLHSREFALKWFGTELFGRKWVESIALAAKELGLAK